MTHTAPKPTKTYELVPAGNHVARLYQIIYVGTVPTEYKGERGETNQLRLTFELCNELKVFKEGDEPKPLSISTRFLTYSMGKKANLRKLVEGMSGLSMLDDEAYAFDHDTLLGEACLLNVVHGESSSGNTFANIQGASPLPKGMKAPEQYNPSKVLDVNTMTQEEIEELPEFLRDKMKSSREYDTRFRQIDPDKELPFD